MYMMKASHFAFNGVDLSQTKELFLLQLLILNFNLQI